MKQLEKISPKINKKFKPHPKFYKLYREKKKLFIAFSDMIMCVTPVGWEIFFIEVHDKLSPTERRLLYAQVCKNKKELIDGAEGRKSVELVNAIYESAETGREVFLSFKPKQCRLGTQKI